MKRVGYLFKELCSFKNLYRAFHRACRGSGKTDEACRFFFRLEPELLSLQADLQSGAYRPAKYRYFQIYDPKERTISVAPFRDRVAHHALVGVIEPVFDLTFIRDSYATRKGKGSHKAILRAQEFLGRNEWYLKFDIEKYFDSIDHELLLALLQRKIKDKRVLDLAAVIIKNSDASRDLGAGKGLPIGNLTSQFFANVYLDPLDHYVKDKLGRKCYLRYMDDGVIFAGEKDCLREVLMMIRTFLGRELHLKLKERATLINTRQHGLPFLGCRIFPGLIRVKNENVRRIKRRMQMREREFQQGKIEEERFLCSMRSSVAHLAFADTLKLRRIIFASGAGVV